MFANRFYVGCDPEFAVLDENNNLLNIRQGFGLLLDDINAGYADPEQIGWDHGGWVGELRPQRQRSIYFLTRNLSTLIKKAGLIFGNNKILGGAYIEVANSDDDGRGICTLGGHIHIDKPVTYGPERAIKDPGGLTVYMAPGLPIIEDVKNLDSLTRLLEHVELLPRASCEQRRILTHYGRYGACTTQLTPPIKLNARWHQEYMSKQHERYEYKTMCSWLFSPEVAYVCLTGAKLVAVLGKETKEILKGTSRKQLRKLFEVFASKDRDADRVLELLDLEKIEIKPNESIVSKWDGWRL